MLATEPIVVFAWLVLIAIGYVVVGVVVIAVCSQVWRDGRFWELMSYCDKAMIGMLVFCWPIALMLAVFVACVQLAGHIALTMVDWLEGRHNG